MEPSPEPSEHKEEEDEEWEVESYDEPDEAVCEEENESGVTNIIEHLVLEEYGYTNSDATEYLKAFKHQCGAHQQAKTYWDHTSYNFSVTNTEDLRKALALTAAISRESRPNWYIHMAVIVVGDVTETQIIIGLIRTYFERQPRGVPQHLEFPLLKQCEPRLTTHVNSEILKMYSNFVVSVECEGCETIKVLETFLMEIARLRVHGIEENELSEGCVYWLRIAGTEYRNRLDHSSEELQNNYTRHFNYRECDLCPKLQAQLIVALTKSINVEKMKSFCELQCKASNLSVSILQSKNFVTQEDMKGSLQKITDLEKEGSLAQWSDEEVEGSNNLILEMEPESGKIVERVEHSDIGAVELILSNGMQVTYQCTKDDEEVRLSGFSYGGLSELAKEDLLSCLFSCEIGQNVLCRSFERFFTACDKVGFNVVVDEYKRAFSANLVDSSYIKLALQIVYFLFTSDLEPEEEDLQAVVDDQRERLSPSHQRLQDILVNTAKEINSGGSCIYKEESAYGHGQWECICISFPLYLERETLDEDRCFLNILRSLMRIKVMYILRHQKRMVVETVVQAMTELQADGPLEHQIQTALDSVPTKEEEELKANTPTRFNADIIKSLLKRFLPWPCSSQYTVFYLTC
ncbi:hypothetical protein RDI58_029847 [Solanum bulbocastanum]|uniref:Peptidase M16 N-terminal domain-containing protein n=1 Tax=Solanum bulbocastanum TaxID=147425 RepID=A0AAN8SYD9_SOLBU